MDESAVMDALAWKADDGDRWALIGGDMRVLEQGYAMPDPDTLQAILYRHSAKDEPGYRRSYMMEYGATPGFEVDLAMNIINSNLVALSRRPDKGAGIDPAKDIWMEASSLLNKVLADNPEIFINLRSAYNLVSVIESQAMKMLSTRLMANIEMQIYKKPSSDALWRQWLFWRQVEGADRPIEPIVESVKLSPITKPGTVPPGTAIGAYYNECKKNEKWPKVISLLRIVWDREFGRIEDIIKDDPNFKISAQPADTNISTIEQYQRGLVQQNSPKLADAVAIPLIDAYLKDGKPNDAKEIFDAWLGCGGTFNDVSKIAELAKSLGQERLAQEWEAKAKK
jgi:hypothetical protein